MNESDQQDRWDGMERDYPACDRVWQRVAPGLDPYPEVRQGSGMEQLPGAAADPCCMGSSARASVEVIRGFIEEEAADRRFYLRFASGVRDSAAARLFRQIAGDKERHTRHLQAAYYLIMGTCCPDGGELPVPRERHYCTALRRAYHEEVCSGYNYLRAAEATGDLCLRKFFREMGEDDLRHGEALLNLLGHSLG